MPLKLFLLLPLLVTWESLLEDSAAAEAAGGAGAALVMISVERTKVLVTTSLPAANRCSAVWCMDAFMLARSSDSESLSLVNPYLLEVMASPRSCPRDFSQSKNLFWKQKMICSSTKDTMSTFWSV